MASLGLNAGMLGSMHSDVLSATPTEGPDKLRLIDELKRRGRLSISSKNYPEALRLYEKGIEVLLTLSTKEQQSAENYRKDLAILYSNASMCHYQLGKLDESANEARKACESDDSYLKGHWRLGQALFASGRYEDAIAAYENGKKLEPNNKALGKEIEKSKVKFEQEKLLLLAAAEQEDEKKQEDDVPVKPTPTIKSVPVSKTSTNATSTATTKTPNDAPMKMDLDDVGFTQSDAVRGYKIVNGKKTSFFHHEQTEEEKRLIGDIAPKKIDTPAATTSNSTDASGTSAWNKAGTWEEKDVTSWAKDTLTASLIATSFTLPAGSPEPDAKVIVTDVKDLSGHASHATVRGKRRFIFEFGFKVNWSVTLPSLRNSTCTGSMTFPDVDGTCEGEYDMVNYTVGTDTPNEAKHVLERFVRNDGLRNEIVNSLNEWVKLFEATYAL